MNTDSVGSGDSKSDADAARAADEAAEWFAKMSDRQVSEQDLRALEAWRARSPANRIAYQELAAIWGNPSLNRALGDAAAGAETLRPARTRRSWATPIGFAAAASVAVFAFLLLRYELPGLRETTTNYETVVGERRVVQLSDGSSVTLNTATRMDVTFRDDERYLRLGQGETYIDVKRDGRPFVVEGGSGRIRVLGTAFNVRVSASQMDVVVERGRVAVSAAGANATGQVLEPQQAVTVQGGRVGSTRPASGEVADWRDGWLDFSDESLASVVRELNRYHSGDIRLGREELANLKVTGRIDLADVDRALRPLARSLGLAVHESPTGAITLE
jgi:transmembrane sensor